MFFLIIETGKIKEIKVVGEQTGTDVFKNQESIFNVDPAKDEDGNIICSQHEYNHIVKWLEKELQLLSHGYTTTLIKDNNNTSWAIYAD